ncbi:basic salivary proline-rich protein 4-like isoform X2 [Drosophila subobscura]|uniref:basic salivary proline-rich protein 4-like isoform X2 n=1 Tax=Drosophila subobscura TaxID=7241 RepID=UPI00155B29A9|nr:basic salivary proline-rich protein 4-like isoform X2 [Drosophila subobscura]
MGGRGTLVALVASLVCLFGPDVVGPARRNECPYGFHWLNPYQRDQCVRMAYRPRQQPDTIRKDFGWFLPDKDAGKTTATPGYPSGIIPWYDSPEERPPKVALAPVVVEEQDVELTEEEATEEPEEGAQNATTSAAAGDTTKATPEETTVVTKPPEGGGKPTEEGGKTPEGGDKNPEGGGKPPAEGSKPPEGGGKPPAEGDKPEGEGKPPEGEETPSEGEGKPPESGDKPPAGGETPSEGEETPSEGGETPSEGGGTPSEGGGTAPGRTVGGNRKSSKRKADQVDGQPEPEAEWHPWSWSQPKSTQKPPPKVLPKQKPTKMEVVEDNQDEWHPWSWSQPKRSSKQATEKVVGSGEITTRKPKTARKVPLKTSQIAEEFPLWSWDS